MKRPTVPQINLRPLPEIGPPVNRMPAMPSRFDWGSMLGPYVPPWASPIPGPPSLSRGAPEDPYAQRLRDLAETRLDAILTAPFSPQFLAGEYSASRLQNRQEPNPYVVSALAVLGTAGSAGVAPGYLPMPFADAPLSGKPGMMDYGAGPPRRQARRGYTGRRMRVILPNRQRESQFAAGVFQAPEDIIQQAKAAWSQESPALGQLFPGASRKSIAAGLGSRVANITPQLFQPVRHPPQHAVDIANEANAERLRSVLDLALRDPQLREAAAWYHRQRMFDQMARERGLEAATKAYDWRNQVGSPLSAGSDVPTEISRTMVAATALPDFIRWGGVEGGAGHLPEQSMGHAFHTTAHSDALNRLLTTGSFFSTPLGERAVKTPLYYYTRGPGLSGVDLPTQTAYPVGDSHFARSLGMPEVRSAATPLVQGGEISPREASVVHPWYQQRVAQPLGLTGDEAQALQWALYGPQTGVATGLGAPLMELEAQRVAEAARRMGEDPRAVLQRYLWNQPIYPNRKGRPSP